MIASHVRAAQTESAGADGFLQRFSLMVWPDLKEDWKDIDRPIDGKAEEEAKVQAVRDHPAWARTTSVASHAFPQTERLADEGSTTTVI